jgi:alpha-galactosidase
LAASPLLALRSAPAFPPGGLGRADLDGAPWRVVPVDVSQDVKGVELERHWQGASCRLELRNRGPRPVRVREVVAFDVRHSLPGETRLYGEGFQMLSQTGGTLTRPIDLGSYTDAGHYKMAAPSGTRAIYGLLTLSPPEAPQLLLGFGSCRRFSGQFYVEQARLQIALDTEGLELAPGERWPLEEFFFASGTSREALIDGLARRIEAHHPRLRAEAPPTGWCSWYCFGPRVTATQVLENLDFIAKAIPRLRYVQIDDGYQTAMGDWLETGAAFDGDVRGVLRAIRQRGFEPALWVAPFIAEAGSRLFREHPDWFVEDTDGRPLRADRVSFGGWRRGPWYAVDGTHPEAQNHLERVFTTMRREWGVGYFKLDANFWGALAGGRHADPKATRVEAYRRGMQAIRRGAGDAFLLGCNQPIWASLGLVHGSRSSNDIKRSWDRIASTARQNLLRNWQNGRLWWNDPDAVVLQGDLPENEFLFHATAIYASGGMVLSGDDLPRLAPERLRILQKLLPPTGVAARFEDDSLRVGRVALGSREALCLLNWDDAACRVSIPLRGPHRITELWSGATHTAGDAELALELAPRSGRVLFLTRED